MESTLSNQFVAILLYATVIFLSLGAVVLVGCLLLHGIRRSGACSFLWQEDVPERMVGHE